MQETIMVILGLVIFPLLIAFIWYLIKSIYVMFQYNTLWGVLGIIFAILGPYPLLSGVFYFTYELDDEDKTIFKRFFMSFFMVIFIGIGSAIILPAWNDHQKRKSLHQSNTSDLVENIKSGDQKTIQQGIQATNEVLGNSPSEQTVTQFLQSVVKETKPHLPMSDGETSIDNIHAQGINLIYDMRANDIIRNNTPITNQILSEIKSEMLNMGGCDMIGHILKHGAIVSYNYYDKNYTFMYRIDFHPKDCGY